jgi:hypothetical protein
MLKDADRVLEARLYAYQRGGATLLEVIDAQRTSAEVYLTYSQALVDHAKALVSLELVRQIASLLLFFVPLELPAQRLSCVLPQKKGIGKSRTITCRTALDRFVCVSSGR